MSIKFTDESNASSALKDMRGRAGAIGADVKKAVSEIIENVKVSRDAALRRYSEKFDGRAPDSFELPRADIESALAGVPAALRSALERAASRIRDFHARQVRQSWLTTSPDGTVMGQLIRPLKRVGVYVPGGTAAYPSTVLMNVIPAKLAGVEEIIMCTPPFRTEEGKAAILSAAAIAGVDRVFTVGGAQAIAAMAYGTESVPMVDKIVGPGNAYVAAAKSAVFGRVDIDMIAGPSEILVVADGTAVPEYVAADLLSQAEHDRLASAILLTTSPKLAQSVAVELETQLAKLKRSDIARASIEAYGLIVICGTVDGALALANEIAPEHLELMTENPMSLLAKLKNAGSIFLGRYSPEPLGDYMAGPNHVLPTGGTARFSSALSVDSFVKKSSFTSATHELLESLSDDIILLANSEGLTAHANAIAVRRENCE